MMWGAMNNRLSSIDIWARQPGNEALHVDNSRLSPTRGRRDAEPDGQAGHHAGLPLALHRSFIAPSPGRVKGEESEVSLLHTRLDAVEAMTFGMRERSDEISNLKSQLHKVEREASRAVLSAEETATSLFERFKADMLSAVETAMHDAGRSSRGPFTTPSRTQNLLKFGLRASPRSADTAAPRHAPGDAAMDGVHARVSDMNDRMEEMAELLNECRAAVSAAEARHARRKPGGAELEEQLEAIQEYVKEQLEPTTTRILEIEDVLDDLQRTKQDLPSNIRREVSTQLAGKQDGGGARDVRDTVEKAVIEQIDQIRDLVSRQVSAFSPGDVSKRVEEELLLQLSVKSSRVARLLGDEISSQVQSAQRADQGVEPDRLLRTVQTEIRNQLSAEDRRSPGNLEESVLQRTVESAVKQLTVPRSELNALIEAQLHHAGAAQNLPPSPRRRSSALELDEAAETLRDIVASGDVGKMVEQGVKHEITRQSGKMLAELKSELSASYMLGGDRNSPFEGSRTSLPFRVQVSEGMDRELAEMREKLEHLSHHVERLANASEPGREAGRMSASKRRPSHIEIARSEEERFSEQGEEPPSPGLPRGPMPTITDYYANEDPDAAAVQQQQSYSAAASPPNSPREFGHSVRFGEDPHAASSDVEHPQQNDTAKPETAAGTVKSQWNLMPSQALKSATGLLADLAAAADPEPRSEALPFFRRLSSEFAQLRNLLADEIQSEIQARLPAQLENIVSARLRAHQSSPAAGSFATQPTAPTVPTTVVPSQNRSFQGNEEVGSQQSMVPRTARDLPSKPNEAESRGSPFSEKVPSNVQEEVRLQLQSIFPEIATAPLSGQASYSGEHSALSALATRIQDNVQNHMQQVFKRQVESEVVHQLAKKAGAASPLHSSSGGVDSRSYSKLVSQIQDDVESQVRTILTQHLQREASSHALRSADEKKTLENIASRMEDELEARLRSMVPQQVQKEMSRCYDMRIQDEVEGQVRSLVPGHVHREMAGNSRTASFADDKVALSNLSAQIQDDVEAHVRSMIPQQIQREMSRLQDDVQSQILSLVPLEVQREMSHQHPSAPAQPASTTLRSPRSDDPVLIRNLTSQIQADVDTHLRSSIPQQIERELSSQLPSRIQTHLRTASGASILASGLDGEMAALKGDIFGQIQSQLPGQIKGQVSTQVAIQVQREMDQLSARVEKQLKSHVDNQVVGRVQSELHHHMSQQPLSPIAGVRSPDPSGVDPTVTEAILQNNVLSQVQEALPHQVRSEVLKQLSAQVSSQVEAQVTRQLRSHVPKEVQIEVQSQLGKLTPLLNQASMPRIEVSQIERLQSDVETQLPAQVQSQVESQLHALLPHEVMRGLNSQLPQEVETMQSRLESKLSGTLSVQIQKDLKSQVQKEVSQAISRELRTQVHSQLPSHVQRELPSQLKGMLQMQVQEQIRDRISAELKSEMFKVNDLVRDVSALKEEARKTHEDGGIDFKMLESRLQGLEMTSVWPSQLAPPPSAHPGEQDGVTKEIADMSQRLSAVEAAGRMNEIEQRLHQRIDEILDTQSRSASALLKSSEMESVGHLRKRMDSVEIQSNKIAEMQNMHKAILQRLSTIEASPAQADLKRKVEDLIESKSMVGMLSRRLDGVEDAQAAERMDHEVKKSVATHLEPLASKIQDSERALTDVERRMTLRLDQVLQGNLNVAAVSARLDALDAAAATNVQLQSRIDELDRTTMRTASVEERVFPRLKSFEESMLSRVAQLESFMPKVVTIDDRVLKLESFETQLPQRLTRMEDNTAERLAAVEARLLPRVKEVEEQVPRVKMFFETQLPGLRSAEEAMRARFKVLEEQLAPKVRAIESKIPQLRSSDEHLSQRIHSLEERVAPRLSSLEEQVAKSNVFLLDSMQRPKSSLSDAQAPATEDHLQRSLSLLEDRLVPRIQTVEDSLRTVVEEAIMNTLPKKIRLADEAAAARTKQSEEDTIRAMKSADELSERKVADRLKATEDTVAHALSNLETRFAQDISECLRKTRQLNDAFSSLEAGLPKKARIWTAEEVKDALAAQDVLPRVARLEENHKTLDDMFVKRVLSAVPGADQFHARISAVEDEVSDVARKVKHNDGSARVALLDDALKTTEDQLSRKINLSEEKASLGLSDLHGKLSNIVADLETRDRGLEQELNRLQANARETGAKLQAYPEPGELTAQARESIRSAADLSDRLKVAEEHARAAKAALAALEDVPGKQSETVRFLRALEDTQMASAARLKAAEDAVKHLKAQVADEAEQSHRQHAALRSLRALEDAAAAQDSRVKYLEDSIAALRAEMPGAADAEQKLHALARTLRGLEEAQRAVDAQVQRLQSDGLRAADERHHQSDDRLRRLHDTLGTLQDRMGGLEKAVAPTLDRDLGDRVDYALRGLSEVKDFQAALEETNVIWRVKQVEDVVRSVEDQAVPKKLKALQSAVADLAARVQSADSDARMRTYMETTDSALRRLSVQVSDIDDKTDRYAEETSRSSRPLKEAEDANAKKLQQLEEKTMPWVTSVETQLLPWVASIEEHVIPRVKALEDLAAGTRLKNLEENVLPRMKVVEDAAPAVEKILPRLKSMERKAQSSEAAAHRVSTLEAVLLPLARLVEDQLVPRVGAVEKSIPDLKTAVAGLSATRPDTGRVASPSANPHELSEKMQRLQTGLVAVAAQAEKTKKECVDRCDGLAHEVAGVRKALQTQRPNLQPPGAGHPGKRMPNGFGGSSPYTVAPRFPSGSPATDDLNTFVNLSPTRRHM
ncbi:hypothetical protein DIPPA_32548 [Diplonema papillatum]|nr:hypothetical protein DIPPA_32548 [Diplonema papillatum]